MTLLAITLLLGFALLVSCFPRPIGHGSGISINGFGGQGWDGPRHSGNWDIGQRDRYWGIPNNGGNFVFDRLADNINGGWMSGENVAYNYDGSVPYGNNPRGKISGDIFRRFGTNGIELGGYMSFE